MKRGTLYFQRQFHNDQGNAEDPTAPFAELQKPDGSWAALSAPAKQNAKTGLYGGSLDMSNAGTYPTGRYAVRVGGTVTTAKTVATVTEFELTEQVADDVHARLGAPTAVSIAADIATRLATADYTPPDNSTIAAIASYVDTEVAAIKAKTDNLPASPAAVGSAMTLTSDYDHAKDDVLTPLAAVKTSADAANRTAPDNAGVAAIKAKTDALPEDPASESAIVAALAGLGVDFAPVLSAIALLGEPAQVDALAALRVIVEAIKAKTDDIDGTPYTVTVTSPVSDVGTITLQAGDDYRVADGRQIMVNVSDPDHVLALDDEDAVVRFQCPQETWVASDVASTTAGYVITFEPTAAQTATLTTARQSYEIEATLADGDVVTLVTGTLIARPDIPAVS